MKVHWDFLAIIFLISLSCTNSLPTLDLYVDNVVVVLDAMLYFAAEDTRITGTELRYLDAPVCGSHGVAHQVNSVQVVLTDTHLSLQSHQDGGDFFFGDVAPLDAMSKWSNCGSPWVWDCVVLHYKIQSLFNLKS